MAGQDRAGQGRAGPGQDDTGQVGGVCDMEPVQYSIGSYRTTATGEDYLGR